MSSPYPKAMAFTAEAAWPRLDHFLAGRPTGLSRSQLRRMIDEGAVQVNGYAVKPSQKLQPGDQVSLAVLPPKPLGLAPQWMPLKLAYQDDHIVVVDKPAGLAVHPGPGHPDRTLVNALLAWCPGIEGIGGEVRPGIVHRLDKDTSGLMVVAKTHQAHQALSGQIKDRTVTKGYLALAVGALSLDQGIIDAPIFRDPRHRKRMAVVTGGRDSKTSYRVLEKFEGYSLVELYLETGRTHQVRVHLAHLGHPLLGDAVYGKPSKLLSRHFLHAHHLGFRHPVTGEALECRSELADDLSAVLRVLRSSLPAEGFQKRRSLGNKR